MTVEHNPDECWVMGCQLPHTGVGHPFGDPKPTPDLPETVALDLGLAARIIGYLHLAAIAGDCEADGIGMALEDAIRRQIGD